MESPKFFNKTILGLSGTVITLSMLAAVACSGNEDTPSIEPAKTAEALQVQIEILKLLNNQNQQERELDHSCGFFLSEGQFSQFRIPTEIPNVTIDFDMQVTKGAEEALLFGGLLINEPTYFAARIMGNDNAFPIGYAIPIADRIFFAPFVESRPYLISSCTPTAQA